MLLLLTALVTTSCNGNDEPEQKYLPVLAKDIAGKDWFGEDSYGSKQYVVRFHFSSDGTYQFNRFNGKKTETWENGVFRIETGDKGYTYLYLTKKDGSKGEMNGASIYALSETDKTVGIIYIGTTIYYRADS